MTVRLMTNSATVTLTPGMVQQLSANSSVLYKAHSCIEGTITGTKHLPAALPTQR